MRSFLKYLQGDRYLAIEISLFVWVALLLDIVFCLGFSAGYCRIFCAYSNIKFVVMKCMLTYIPLASYAGVFRGYVFPPSPNSTSSLKKLVYYTAIFIVVTQRSHQKGLCSSIKKPVRDGILHCERRSIFVVAEKTSVFTRKLC